MAYSEPELPSAVIFDLDTSLPFPCPLDTYVNEAFKPSHCIAQRFKALFRAVEGQEFMSHFSSDRSHMLKPDGSYSADPPAYPPIYNGRDDTNVMGFVDMKNERLPGENAWLGV